LEFDTKLQVSSSATYFALIRCNKIWNSWPTFSQWPEGQVTLGGCWATT